MKIKVGDRVEIAAGAATGQIVDVVEVCNHFNIVHVMVQWPGCDEKERLGYFRRELRVA